MSAIPTFRKELYIGDSAARYMADIFVNIQYNTIWGNFLLFAPKANWQVLMEDNLWGSLEVRCYFSASKVIIP